MNLLTTVDIPKPDFNIGHNDAILSVGSCFAENITAKMTDAAFKVLSNPSGVLYNPYSIGQCISFLLEKKKYQTDELAFDGELYFNYDFHGSHSSPDKKETLHNINSSISHASEWIRKTDVLVITFGTSWIYELKVSGQIVANCHKQPASLFNRRRLEPSEIVAIWQSVITNLKSINTKLRIVFSISPVRHFKDGTFENQLSKSGLFVAINELVNANAHCSYFPAYEIMMDELRDYRFYASDMLHPSDVAVDYIWEKFGRTYFSEQTSRLCRRAEGISKSLKHRPFRTDTIQYGQFRKKLLNEIENLEKEYPNLDFVEGKKSLLHDNIL